MRGFGVEVSVEHPRAVRTSESFYSSMHFHMLVQVRPLGERESTVREWTAVWSLIGVNSKVIEEIVPLSEMLATVFMVTFQDLNVSFRLRILERKDSEFLRSGNMLLDLN